jgi:hypothetical protein
MVNICIKVRRRRIRDSRDFNKNIGIDELTNKRKRRMPSLPFAINSPSFWAQTLMI